MLAPKCHSPLVRQQLAEQVEERNTLLKQAEMLACEDGHVAGAWLLGSLGRVDEDELSDIDLFVIVKDEAHL